jgi:hypothetical protein
MANPVAEDERKVYEPLDIIRAKILGREGQELEKQTRQLFVNWTPIRSGIIPFGFTANRSATMKDPGTRWNPISMPIRRLSSATVSAPAACRSMIPRSMPPSLK